MPKLVQEGKDSVYSVENKCITIGRFQDCDIVIHDNLASKRHCEIGKENTEYYVKDLNSFNGTYVNEKRITSASLKWGDRIKIGKTTFIFAESKEEIPTPQAQEISPIQPSPALIIKAPKQKTRSVLLHEEKYSIGRKEISNDICIKDSQISSQHAQIIKKDNEWWIFDLKSKNGVFVNQQATESCMLKDGDSIRVGDTICLFQYNLQKKNTFLKKRLCVPISFVLSVVVLIFLGQSFFKYKQTHLAFLPGNLLEDFSFEGGLSWECRGGMQITESTARSGKFSLFYTSQSESSYHESHESQYVDPIELSYGKTYSVSAWIKYQKLIGVAGIRIVWFYKQEKLFEEYSPLLTGNNEKWSKIEFLLSPPPYATAFQLVLFAVGKAENLYFDDIYVKENDSSMDDPRLSLQNLGINLVMDTKGIFHIYSQIKHLLSFGKFYIWEQQQEEKKWISSQEFSYFKVRKQEQDWIAQGTMQNLRGESIFLIKIVCKESKENFSFTYTLKGIQKNSNSLVEYIFSLPYDFVDKENESAASHRIILTTPGTKNKIGFFYQNPMEYRINKDSQYIRFCYPVAPDENNEYTFSMKVKTNFKEDIGQLEEWKKVAQKHYQEKQWGKASIVYESIVEHLVFHPFAMIAKQRWESLKELFQKDLYDLTSLLQHSLFFHNEIAYDDFIQKCKEGIKKWEGLSAAVELEKLLLQAQSQKEAIRKSKIEKSYLYFLHLAENFHSLDKKHLAYFVYEDILENLQDKTKEPFLLEKIQFLKTKSPK
ncbi:MAG: FHA domain-containing protein [Candidatus Brocadiae bacterium]|nr:FHA domain-containing protein [Candidatus Brocadiia bacterium]